MTDRLKFHDAETLRHRLTALTAKHAALWAIPVEDNQERFTWSVSLADTSREIVETMRELYELTGDEIYKV